MRTRPASPHTTTHAHLLHGPAIKPRPSPNQHRLRPLAPPTTQTTPPSGPAPRAMRKGSGGSRRSRGAAGSGPGPGAVQLGVPGSVLGFPPRTRRCPRPFLPLVAVAAAAAILYAAWPGAERSGGGEGGGEAQPPRLRPLPPSEKHLRTLLGGLSPPRLWDALLHPLLRERPPGSAGSRAVRQHITTHLSALSAGWHLDLDTFAAPTPRGTVTFSNLVATLSPSAPLRLALACHYDTKVLMSPPAAAAAPFIGATDSAVPCAMLMEVAAALDGPLRSAKEGDAEVTLQLLFLDGEEAFEEWSATDSLYGARHLAARMAATRHGAHGTQLSTMSLLVLLDLLGAQNPAIHSHFPQTHHWFLRLVAIEKRLRRLGLLHASPHDQPFFRLSPAPGSVEDDHIPFLQRGVPVLHLIPLPFPWVWHTAEDNKDNLHPPTIEDLCKILTAFVAEFLQL